MLSLWADFVIGDIAIFISNVSLQQLLNCPGSSAKQLFVVFVKLAGNYQNW